MRFLRNSSLVACCVFIASASAAVRYVDINNSNPTSPFSSWATAATNIQDAITIADNGDEIVVTNGVYATGSIPLTGSGRSRVALNKPLTLRSVNGPGFTVIEGHRNPINPYSPESIRCVRMASGSILSGFTLRNGSTASEVNSPGAATSFSRGGGVFCSSLSSIVTNCVLENNSAHIEGGGSYGGTLINCVITNNTAINGGGSAGGRLGFSDFMLINCTIAGNRAPSEGGGACAATTIGRCKLVNCLLTNNYSTTSASGGAMRCTLDRCILIRNGGGAFYCTLNNCAIVNNDSAGAQFCTLNNCTVSGNFTGLYGGGAKNSIVYDNLSTNYDGGTYLEYSCTTPLPADRIGNVDSLSACVDAGNTAYVTGALDLAGRPRIIGARVDIGAYEFQGPFDQWLAQNGLATGGSADFTDPDGDGLNNWQEWNAGTAPTNAESALRILGLSSNAAGVEITWQSVADRRYYVERSSGAGGNQDFLAVASDIPGKAVATSCVDVQATGSGPFFYQVGLHADANEFTYSNLDGTISITGFGGAERALVISSNLAGGPVTSIGDGAFSSKPDLVRVTLPGSVSAIGARSFGSCPKLASVLISAGVTNIGDWAFSSCPSLTRVNLPNTIEMIGAYSFAESGLTNVLLPDSLLSIGDGAFESCGLTQISIPKNVSSIGESVFVGCQNLGEIAVDVLNASFSADDGVLFNHDKTMLMVYPASKIGTAYTIPDQVTNIGAYAFYFCQSLAAVSAPEGVRSIGKSAFYWCSSLTNLVLPNSVVSIGDNAFNSCINLTNIALPNAITSIETQTFQGCTSLTNITIPAGVTNIASLAFNVCTKLDGVIIPDTVTHLGAFAFQDCSGLKAVYFEGDAPSVDDGVFAGADNVVVYYRSDRAGWGADFGGRQTAIWTNP